MKKNVKKLMLMLLAGSALGHAGCASILTGDSEDIYITTGKDTGAKCTLSNNRGSWTVASTPGTVNIKRSISNLIVNCDKNKLHGSRSIGTSIKSAAAGNLILGGPIGAGIDASTGAAFDYPDHIDIYLS